MARPSSSISVAVEPPAAWIRITGRAAVESSRDFKAAVQKLIAEGTTKNATRASPRSMRARSLADASSPSDSSLAISGSSAADTDIPNSDTGSSADTANSDSGASSSGDAVADATADVAKDAAADIAADTGAAQDATSKASTVPADTADTGTAKDTGTADTTANDSGASDVGSSDASASDAGNTDAGAGKPGSCAGSCGGKSKDGCWCDSVCSSAGDCCSDFAQLCACKQDSDCTKPGSASLCETAKCNSGICSTTTKTCPKTAECLVGTCNPQTGACEDKNASDGSTCSDNDKCTGGDACQAGKCTAGKTPVNCDDNNPCTADGCDPKTGQCASTPLADGGKCDDGKACSAGDACKSGACVGVAVPCDDGNPCTTGDACASGQCTAGGNNCACTGDADCAGKETNKCEGTLYCDKSKAPFVCKINPLTVVKCDTTQNNQCQTVACDSKTGKCVLNKKPDAATCDADGNIFVVDCENHCIRRIDAKTNVVTTVAGGRKGTGGDGGPAVSAGMDRPHGCVLSANGGLYIADSNNHRVRFVQLSR